MRIAIGSDHAAIELKAQLKAWLEAEGYAVRDFGPATGEKAEYPLSARKVAGAVTSGDCALGLLLCGTGVGISIAANKVRGIRACCCSEPFSAMMSRQHNDSNILCMGARVVGTEYAKMILAAWLGAEFEGGRHAERVELITAMESGFAMENSI